MAVDKKDWLKLQAKQKREASKGSTATGPDKRVVEILTGKLANTPEWNQLKGHIAEQIHQCELMTSGYQEILLSHERVNQDDLMRAKIGYHAHQAALEALTGILDYTGKLKKVDDDQ